MMNINKQYHSDIEVITQGAKPIPLQIFLPLTIILIQKHFENTSKHGSMAYMCYIQLYM